MRRWPLILHHKSYKGETSVQKFIHQASYFHHSYGGYGHGGGWGTFIAHSIVSGLIHGLIYSVIFKIMRDLTIPEAIGLAVVAIILVVLWGRRQDRY
jgi:hypothetical protein